MTHDPYAPPLSASSAVVAAPGPRPISAWLLLAVLGLIATITTFSVARTEFLFISNVPGGASAGRILVVLVSWAVIVGLMVVTMIGIWRRKQWGRWLGALFILGLAISMVVMPSKTTFNSDAERAGGRFAKYAFLPLLMAGWMYRFAFSEKARRYFQ